MAPPARRRAARGTARWARAAVLVSVVLRVGLAEEGLTNAAVVEDTDISSEAVEAMADGEEVDNSADGAAVQHSGTGPYGLIPEDYDPEVPPLIQVGDMLPARSTVLIGVKLRKIMNVDPDSGVVMFCAWLRLYWYDPRLSFNGTTMFPHRRSSDSTSAELDLPWTSTGQSHVSLDPGNIWKPDVFLREKVDAFVESCSEEPALLFDDTFTLERAETMGQTFNVYWGRACVLAIQCKQDLSNFPFDENSCNITFQPWSETMYRLKPAPAVCSADLPTQQFLVNITNINGTLLHVKEHLPGGGDYGTFDAVRWSITLKRHPNFYVVNYFLPTIALVSLSWLTFFVPLDSSDRISYAVTLTLTAMAVALLTTDRRPPDKGNMWIDRFQTTAFIAINIPIVETVLLLRLASLYKQGRGRGTRANLSGLDRLFRVVYVVWVVAWLAGMFLPGSPWATDAPDRWYSDACAMMALFWLPLAVLLTLFSVQNLMLFRMEESGQLRDALSGALLDHYTGPEGKRGSCGADEEDGTSLESWSSR
ncbi:unnamed protein product [Prorocentrum cordatum]|uniref:Neurotransmitter-gated ion-channel ligand-binding domain-containing protein n=1 Tax=Prorocentrum cordatum TaxID=2364126 RepID=A0ABN9YJG2_9DINO|nr:unnamed protein product [Polarella glacialis]